MSKTTKKLSTKFRCLIRCESGQDLVEYGLAVTLIALLCISGMQGAAGSVDQIYGQIAQAIDQTQQAPDQQQSPTPTPHHHHNHDGGGGGWGWWHH
jgi:Flp pilus assembly pilin Flp